MRQQRNILVRLVFFLFLILISPLGLDIKQNLTPSIKCEFPNKSVNTLKCTFFAQTNQFFVLDLDLLSVVANLELKNFSLIKKADYSINKSKHINTIL